MPRSILIVDDEASIAVSLDFLMRQQGYAVRVAPDGETALAAMAEATPDLVLLDVMLPGRSGYEVCHAIRANPAWAGVKILMVTAKGRLVDEAQGLSLGADGYLIKPFGIKEILEKVKGLLGEV